MDLDVDDDVRVLAGMDHSEHADVPVVWTKPYGDGRGFYTSLGHGTPSLTDDGVRQLIRNGTRWAAGESEREHPRRPTPLSIEARLR